MAKDSLVPGTEMALGFRSDGMPADVLVKVGDRIEARVCAGQLAVLAEPLVEMPSRRSAE